MWFVPLAAALGLGAVLFLLHFWHQKRQTDSAKIYRSRFIQLVAQLDTITTTVTQLEGYVRQVKAQDKLLDYYESTLRVLETLLSAVRHIPPFGLMPGNLDSAFFLVKDLRYRVGRTQQGFQDVLRGRTLRLEDLYGQKRQNEATGCYFCSRPVIANRFSKVRVRIDNRIKEVMSCRICREELEQTKKVKVLYFMKGEEPVHWSQVKDYHPSEDFWNINQRDPVRKSRKLELIYSRAKMPLATLSKSSSSHDAGKGPGDLH
jgi:hypothetical protein